ncbi:hypothetical protein [Corynebacterium sp. CCM 9203]|uniref:hypothetical protein n=1 Tax=Corynebacterium sp. CCM 9203 TaxID=3057615 RepID=UPI003526173C
MNTPPKKSPMARRSPTNKKTPREILATPVRDVKKTSFTLDAAIYAEFRRRVFLREEKMTTVIEQLIARYLEETEPQ